MKSLQLGYKHILDVAGEYEDAPADITLRGTQLDYSALYRFPNISLVTLSRGEFEICRTSNLF